MSWFLSTSKLLNAGCAPNDPSESIYSKLTRIFHWARHTLALTVFFTAIAVVGCEAAPLRHYRTTISLEHVWLSLWPLNLDLRPTIGLLCCGSIIAFQSLIYIIAALIPSPLYSYTNIKRLNHLATASALSGLITALAGVLLAIYLPTSESPRGFSNSETLQSWTCKWKEPVSFDDKSLRAPVYFASDCAASRIGLVLLGVLIGLEVVMSLAAVAGYWIGWRWGKDEKLIMDVVDGLSLKA